MGILRKLERARNAYFGNYINGIKHYNFWGSEGSWIGDFIRARFPEEDWKKFSIVSVFGTPRTFWFHKNENKIFFTGENPDRYPNYKNHALPHVKLSMGFDDIDAANYLRFPLWIAYLFKPEAGYQEIKAVVDTINSFHPDKPDFASLICRHGGDDNLRGIICDQLSEIAPVKCAGKFKHNDDRLWKEYDNNKHNYLSNFKFSICPENSNRSGYVTEKLFESFKAAAIPVYWGSDNNPEPGLINHNAVMFWQPGGDNTKLLTQIEELYKSPRAYQEFAQQPRLLPELTEYVWNCYQELESRLKAMIK